MDGQISPARACGPDQLNTDGRHGHTSLLCVKTGRSKTASDYLSCFTLSPYSTFDIRYPVDSSGTYTPQLCDALHFKLALPPPLSFVSSALHNGNRIHPTYRGCRPPGLRDLLDHQTQPRPPPAWSKALSHYWQPPQLPPRSFLRRIHKMAKRVRCGQISHYTALQCFESLKCPNAPTQVMSSTPTSLVNPST